MSTDTAPISAPHLDTSRYRVTYSIILVAVVSYALLQSFVLPVLPTIQHSLHTTVSGVTWVLTAYLLSAAVFTPVMGRVGDILGKKRTFVLTLCALALGSLIGALAHSIGVMIVARVIQGIGGGVLPLSFGIIRDEFPQDKVVSSVATTAAVAAAGGALGIIVVGPLLSFVDFHWLFWLPMIVTGSSAIAAAFVLPVSLPRPGVTMNWPAALLLSAWLIALLLAISEGQSWGWGSTRVIALYVIAVAIAAVWVRIELSSAQPLIDMRTMRQPVVWSTNLVAFMFGFGLYASFTFMPQFVQTKPSVGYGFGASVTGSGLFLLPLSAMMFVAGFLSSHAARRFGSKRIIVTGSVISLAAFSIVASFNHAPFDIYLVMGLLGVGFGIALSATSYLIVEAVPPSQTAVASAMNANIRTIGGSIGAAVMSSIVTSSIHAGGLPTAAGYDRGYTMLAFGAGLAVLSTLFIPRNANALNIERASALADAVGEPAVD